MDFKTLIQGIESLPSLPQAYHKCCFLLERDVTDSKDLAQVVSTDPGMTLAVLKLVNSAFYNIPRKIERLDHAISIIGHAKFSDLILTAAVVKAMSTLVNGKVDIEVYWRHSIFTALVAKRLGLHAYLSNSERLFLAGLLHDVGQLIYFDRLATKALKVSELVTKFNVDETLAENKVLGFTRQDIAGEICKLWQLPEWIEQPIIHQNQPSNSTYFKHEATIISIANAIAEQHYPGLTTLGAASNNAESILDDPNLWASVNIDPSKLSSVVNEANEQMQSVIESLVPELPCVS